MRSDLVDALAEPGDRPSAGETDRALRLVRRRHNRRRAGAIGSVAVVVIAVAGALGAVIATNGQQIVADGPASESPDSTDRPADEGEESSRLDGAPLSNRFGATVAWTGTELIVSGGFRPAATNEFADAELLVDGAAYNPISETWRPIADRPAGALTWPAAVWTGEVLLVVGAAGSYAYDPVSDEWTVLATPPFPVPDLVRDNEFFEFAWSGDVFYLWRPSTDQMAFYSLAEDRWETMPSPDMDAFPAKLLADGNRLVALGTGWPSSGVPVSFDVEAAEWIDGQWRSYEPVSFVTENFSNTADVDAASLIDGTVVVWGDLSEDPGPTFLLDAEGNWSEAPPMPIDAGMGHPGSVLLGDRLLALSEGSDAAIFETDTRTWTVTRLPSQDVGGPIWSGTAASQSVWTGSEVLAWTGSTVVRWIPPFGPVSGSSETSSQSEAGDRFVYPSGCGPTSFGRADTHSNDVLGFETEPSWTRSDAGQWLEARITEAGFPQPFDAGSAFVLAHGVDGSAFIWLGPENDTANLDLSPLADNEANADGGVVEPTSPFDGGPYRSASVFTTAGGGVRLWLLVNPRDMWEATNFPGLSTGAPCLPDDQTLIDAMLTIASGANRTPYQGQLPDTAGRFVVNSDVGISATDPGDRHLIEVAAQVLDAPLRQPGSAAVISHSSSSRWVYTGTPPYETDPNVLASASRSPQPRASAGGLDILFWLQDGPQSLTVDELSDLQLIASALNTDPFLGQPTP